MAMPERVSTGIPEREMSSAVPSLRKTTSSRSASGTSGCGRSSLGCWVIVIVSLSLESASEVKVTVALRSASLPTAAVSVSRSALFDFSVSHCSCWSIV